ncbi:hypothetical protein VF21_10226 [Pseudogymnoascus sp. 05NY08]|nr:hypothetical protein VF21_10226 [Pseudogymnoascus sp. 05NY08]
MFAALVSIVNDVALGPENQKVKKYLDNGTCDSVARDLGKVLSSQLRGFKERELLQTTFYKYCIEGPFQQKCKNEESFTRHVRSTHSKAAISDAALQLLWRSFHFYAYHPFPRVSQYGQVDFDAFQRAVLLTAFQCDDLLGTRELEWFWRNDAAFFRRASFKRMFRSIGVPETTTRLLKQQNGMTSTLSDAMDVFIMVGPQFMHAAPSPEQLEAVARNLFAREPTLTQREVRREDVSTLVDLLLRMRLNKEKWGSFYHLGDFVDASPADNELTEALVNSLIGDGSEQTVTSDQLLRAIDIVANLQVRFYQLWAVLFQPSALTAEAKLSRAPETMPTHINGAISLFAPQFMTENRYHLRTVQQDSRLALKRAQSSPDSHDTTIVRLVQALSRHPSACIVLFSSEAVGTTPKIVIGAYFPGSLNVSITRAENEKRETQSNTSHLLFQLQPSFRLLRSGKPNISITDLIKTEGQGVSLADIATNEVIGSPNLSYWIGDGTSQSEGLRIDPQKKTAMLASSDGQWYRDLMADENSQSKKNWEVTAQNPRMDIFMVTSDVN